jgi:hypothetical protein
MNIDEAKAVLALLTVLALHHQAAAEQWQLAETPESAAWTPWYTNTGRTWNGPAEILHRICDVSFLAPGGKQRQARVAAYFAPSTRCFGFVDGYWDYNLLFAFRDRMVLCQLDNTLYSYALLLTNQVPQGADADQYLQTQQREYLRTLSPSGFGHQPAAHYFGYYLGEGQITRDPATHEVLRVNHFAGASLDPVNPRTDGTNLTISIRADGGVADLIFNEDMKPIGGIQAGKLITVDPANNTYFMQKSWGQEAEGLRLALTLNKTAFKSGEPITGTVWVQNVTNVARQFPALMLGGQILTVTDSTGKPFPSIASQHHPQTFIERVKSISVDRGDIRVPPGAHVNIEVNITTQYDLTVPGQYKVRFALKIPAPDPKSLPVAVTPEMPIQILPK